MKFRILGPLEVADDDGRTIALAAPKVRALLARLLLDRNRAVQADVLVDELWDERPPATATKTLQVYVSQLRRALGAERLTTSAGGYVLRVEAGELDVDDFEQLVADSRWHEALALWRGPALVDVRGERFAAAAAERLEELRLATLEERIDADLVQGRHGALVGELEQLAQEHPLRERLRAQLMLALYRSGRQAEALDVYRRTRDELVEGLGLEPSAELRELEQAILRQDPALRYKRPPREAEQVLRKRWPLLVAVAAAVFAGSYLLSRSNDNGSGNGNAGAGAADVRVFTVKVENVLAQAHAGRVAVQRAVDSALRCTKPLDQAAAGIEDVTANRNSLLQQIAALNVPDDERARRSASLLQQAAAASFAADLGYRRDILRAKRCPPKLGPGPGARANRLKRAFVSAFNPLAARFHLATWSPGDF